MGWLQLSVQESAWRNRGSLPGPCNIKNVLACVFGFDDQSNRKPPDVACGCALCLCAVGVASGDEEFHLNAREYEKWPSVVVRAGSVTICARRPSTRRSPVC